MNRTEILEKLNEVFHDVFDNNDIVVTEQTNANDIEEWDSLIHITLISAVEDEFDVSFSRPHETFASSQPGRSNLPFAASAS